MGYFFRIRALTGGLGLKDKVIFIQNENGYLMQDVWRGRIRLVLNGDKQRTSQENEVGRGGFETFVNRCIFLLFFLLNCAISIHVPSSARKTVTDFIEDFIFI